ncbi:MAG: AraC family transcriptional regulator [Caulobacteraceae bacterium]|nr:AraC family transcriptional regulator [Caulobacteraceae bacterium]
MSASTAYCSTFVPEQVTDLRFRHEHHSADANIDIRQYRWTYRCDDAFSPPEHYIDLSLDPRPRLSGLRSHHWTGSRPSGEMLYMPPGESYVGEMHLGERNMLCVGLRQQFLEDLFVDDGGLPEMRPWTDIHNAGLRRLLIGLANEVAIPSFGGGAMIQTLLSGIGIILGREMAGVAPAASDAPLGSRQIRVATEYIADNLDGQLSIGVLARECGVSARQLMRMFKREFGMTFGAYVAASRITLAKDLLGGTPRQIKEVAALCGFQSASAFGAAFHTAVGVTPGEFRDR